MVKKVGCLVNGWTYWLAKMTLPKSRYLIFIFSTFLAFQNATQANESYNLSWSDRVSEEQADGTIVDTAPFVHLGNLRLSRFSQMQSLQFQETIATGDGDEKLHVFTAWQGGASQGEQLMLVTTSKDGIDVIGPHEQDFETMEVVPASADRGPTFLLYGAGDGPIATLEYFSGQLIAQ